MRATLSLGRWAGVPVGANPGVLVELQPRMAGCADGRAVVLDDEQRVLAVVSPRDIAGVAALADLRPGQ